MSRILTGIQSTGTPHLGNILGAIIPAIEMSNKEGNESFLFIADLHSLTQIKNKEELKHNTYSVAATWLAFGLNPKKTVFYRQSDVPECTELAWYISCFFPYQRLKLAHSFKDKSSRLQDVNAGLFIYPILMAADILLYNANYVPVGRDQLQHLEITRDIASRINSKIGDTLVVPEAIIQKNTMLIPGTDGEKMSKSKNNTINVLDSKNEIKKIINKKIITDDTPLEKPKDPDTSTIYKLYSLLASKEDSKIMHDKLKAGGYGWGHAKKDLLTLIDIKFSKEREKYLYYMNNLHELDNILLKGANKASKIAKETNLKLRNKLGY
jgi:tryptophanyl-tRNA synthetase